jgi:hypothetical protein
MKQYVERLAQIETEARRMARSGVYVEYSAIQWRLEERGFSDAHRLFKNPWTRAEIDRLCRLARQDVKQVA